MCAAVVDRGAGVDDSILLDYRRDARRGPPPADWTNTIRTCITGLLPTLTPRDAKLIRRLDLEGQLKVLVAHELRLEAGAFNVAVHRARRAMRKRLEQLCVLGDTQAGQPRDGT